MTEHEDQPRVRVTDRRIDFDAPEPEPLVDETGAEVVAEGPSELEQLQAKADALQDQLLRERAEFANIRQRMTRDQTHSVEMASQRILEKLVPVVDDFERALASAIQHGDEAIVKGIEIVLRQFHQVLAAEGLEKVDPQGSAFDPAEHEAMAAQPGDVGEPMVLDVVRPGYKLKGRVLRPAQVLVQVPREQEQE